MAQVHQQFSNLLIHFFPLFDLLPQLWQAESGKAEKLS